MECVTYDIIVIPTDAITEIMLALADGVEILVHIRSDQPAMVGIETRSVRWSLYQSPSGGQL